MVSGTKGKRDVRVVQSAVEAGYPTLQAIGSWIESKVDFSD
jgi:hypothetical protein